MGSREGFLLLFVYNIFRVTRVAAVKQAGKHYVVTIKVIIDFNGLNNDVVDRAQRERGTFAPNRFYQEKRFQKRKGVNDATATTTTVISFFHHNFIYLA